MKRLKFLKSKYLIIGLFLILSLNITFSIDNNMSPLFFYGASGSLNINVHFANFNKLETVPSCCPRYRSTFDFGWSLAFFLRKQIFEKIELGLNFGIAKEGAKFVENEFIGNTAVKYVTNPTEIKLSPVFVDHFLNSKIYTLNVVPEVYYHLSDNLWLMLGVSFGNLILAKIDQKEVITSPSNIVFIDGKSTRNEYYDLDLPSVNVWQIRPTFGASYDFDFLDIGKISPFIRISIPTQNITSLSWKVMPVQFGVAIRFPIYPPPEIHYYYDTLFLRDTTKLAILGLNESKIILESSNVVRTDKIKTDDGYLYKTTVSEKYRYEVPKASLLTTSLSIVGIGRDGKEQKNPTLVIEEIETEEMFPLLPYIFFPTGEFLLSKSQMKLLNKEIRNEFSESNLEWNTISIWANLLNIIGSRLQKFPNSSITIVGCNSNSGIEAKNIELSRKRAEEVKNYLVDVWDISPKRISLKFRHLPEKFTNPNVPEGNEENQRVEIYSNDFNILQPVRLREIQRTSNPPIIEIHPQVYSESSLEGWGLSIEQGSEKIRLFSGVEIPTKVLWNVEEEPIPKFEIPIQIVFYATDIFKQKESSKVELRIEQKTIRKKREILKEDKKIEKFSLIVFDFDQATIPQHQKSILDDIKQRIQPNSKVTITGYTDIIGEPTYNKNLALRRCTEISKFLGLPNSQVEMVPIGSDYLLYDNSTPQGRSYSRTVQIMIETPIKNK